MGGGGIAAAREKPAKIRGDLLYLSDMGGDPEAILAGSDVSFQSIKALEPINNGKMADLLHLLASRTSQDFGVRCGLALRPQYLGVLGLRLANCNSLRDLLDTWARYSVVIGYPLASQVQITHDRWRLEFWPRYPLSEQARRFCFDSSLAGVAPILHALSSHWVTIGRIGFPHARPSQADHYDELAAADLRFGEQRGYVEGQLADLALPIKAAEAEARQLSETYCRAMLSQIAADESTASRIGAVLANLTGAVPTAAGMAARLGMSLRTLQRDLALQNLSYQGLVDSHRHAQALTMLERGIELKTIAFYLGYRDVASFRRAFKRWTGEPPGTGRTSLRKALRRAGAAGITPSFW